MNLIELSQCLQDLNWNNSEQIQKEAINKLKHIDEVEMVALIRPRDKQCWENAAQVISEIGYPKNRKIILGLLEWIKDLNWPGSEIVWEILKNVEIHDLASFIEEAVIKAVAHNDGCWLSSIRQLVIEINIDKTMFKRKDIYEDLLNSNLTK